MKKYYGFILGLLLIPTTVFASEVPANSSWFTRILNTYWVKQILFPYINFVLFIAIVIYLANKPIRKFLSDRKRTIETTMKESAQMYAQAEADINHAKIKTAELPETLNTLRTNLHAEAQAEQKRLSDNVMSQASQLRHDLEKQIHADEIMAKQALQAMLVKSMQEVARQTIKTTIKPEEQTRFSQEFIGDIKNISLSHSNKDAV